MKKIALFLSFFYYVVMTFAQTHITDRAGLENIKNDLAGSYVLDSDINLSGSNWTPLGDFTGTFDGNGHVIYNMTPTPKDGMGLFTRIKGSAVVKKVGFENATVNGGTNVRVAVVAGYLEGAATIENCYVANSTVSGRWCIGSFVGRAQNITGAAAIRNCYSGAIISVTADDNSGNGHAGGIIGNIYYNGPSSVTVENCYFSGIVKKDVAKANDEGQVAGIIGWNGHDAANASSIVKNNVNLAPYLLSPNGKHRIASQRSDNTAYGNPSPGPNYSLSTTSVAAANTWGTINQVSAGSTHYGLDKKDGENIPDGDVKAKTAAFYTGLGWNLSTIWTIAEGASYPYFSWAADTTNFVVTPATITVAEGSPVDLSKYIFSGRGRSLSFSASDSRVSISGSVISIVPPVATDDVIAVTVTEAGQAQTYALNVNIEATKSKNANMASLTLSAGELTPSFNPAITSYTVLVPQNVTSITSTATAEDALSTVEDDGAIIVPATQTIKVTAEYGNTKTYTINYVIPTYITDRAGLAAVSGNGNYILGNDIDLSDSNWTPLGNFTGILDGNKHVISGLTIDNLDAAALFNTISGRAVVKNLGFEKASISDATHSRTAVLAAFLEGDAIIENCYIANSHITGRWCTGSFVGRARNLTANGIAAIRNCYSSATIFVPYHNDNAGMTGGIIGNIYAGNKIVVENCYFSGYIYKDPATVKTEGNIAGIVGWIGQDNDQRISGYNILNNVNLSPYLLSNNGKHRISSTRSDENVNDPTPGPNYSLSTTVVDAYNNWGSSLFITNGTAANKDGANIPAGDANAKAQSFYAVTLGWNFTNIWTIGEGASYPYFSWQKDAASFVVTPATITLSEGSPVDLSKYIFSGRGRTLTFTSNDPRVSISGSTITLVPPVPSADVIDITVQESTYTGDTRTLQITLQPTASINADLSDITLSAGSLVPAFHPDMTEYTVSVPAGVTSITSTAVVANANADAAGDGAIDVTAGATQTITVTAEAGNTKVYMVNYLKLGAGAADVTGLVVNNSFEYAFAGYKLSDHTKVAANGDPALNDGETAPTGWTGNAWRAAASTYEKFYGWETSISPITVANFGTNSQGLNRDIDPREKIDGMYALWFGGNLIFPDVFELYQTIDKDNLPAGTYKVQARLAVADNKRTSQRLFANQNVQYHGLESQYAGNLTNSEIATFAGWGDGEKNLQEMIVYTTIADNEDLKFGIRTGGKKGDGTTADLANPPHGWFKTDYFRVTKIDNAIAADATLASLSVSDGVLVPGFSPATTSYAVSLPYGTVSVTPAAVPTQAEAKVTGANAVDVSSGSGVSTIIVTALNATTATYTINYTVEPYTGIATTATPKVSYSVSEGKLTVTGADSYTVYALNGMKIADVKSGISVVLEKGVYIVRTNNAQTLKVIVR